MTMSEAEQAIVEQAQAQVNAANVQAQQGQAQAVQQSIAMEGHEMSMAQEQLDLSEEKAEIEHLLRGHIIKTKDDGSPYWDEPEDKDEAPLNEYGVRVIMKLISFYLCKRKLLSNYSQEMIDKRLEDFGTELADLIFMKYKEMGMDTPEKRKLYSSIVNEITDAVEDVYLRALAGKERESLRRHWNITENVGGLGQQQPPKINPMNWLRR